jgi:hypothetical protein
MIVDKLGDQIMFTKDHKSEYFDGYYGQPVYYVDDFMQKKDTMGDRNEQPMEVISGKSSHPWLLNMADCSSKSNTYFKSLFMLLSSNLPPEGPKNILACEDAFLRRLDVVLTQTVLQEYTHVVGKANVIDSDKVNQALSDGILETNLDIYRFSARRGGTNESLFSNYSFTQLVGFLEKDIPRHFNDQHLARKNFASYDDMRRQRFAELYNKDSYVNQSISSIISDGVDKYYDTVSDLASEVSRRAHNTVDVMMSMMSCINPYITRVIGFIRDHYIWFALLGASLGIIFMIMRKWLYPDIECFDLKHYQFAYHKTSKWGSYSVEFDRPTKSVVTHINDNNPIFRDSASTFSSLFHLALLHGATPESGFYSIAGSFKDDHDELLMIISLIEQAPFIKSLDHLKLVDYYRPCVKAFFTEGGSAYAKSGRSAKRSKVKRLGRKAKALGKRGGASGYDFEADNESLVDSKWHQFIDPLIRNNIYAVVNPSEKNSSGFNRKAFTIIFLKDNIALAPKHAVTTLQLMAKAKLDPMLCISRTKDGMRQIPFDPKRIAVHCKNPHDDWCYLEFLSRSDVPSAPNIVKHFVSESDLERMHDFWGIFCRPSTRVQGLVSATSWSFEPGDMFSHDSTSILTRTIADDGTSLVYRDVVGYSINTEAGDCGNPVIYSSDSSPYKIVGIHALGDKNGNHNFAQIITREILESELSSIQLQPQSGFSMDLSEYLGEFVDDVTGDFIPLGKVKDGCPVVWQNTETEISPSILSGLIAPVTEKPAYLHPITIDGVKVYPMEKALAKAGERPIHIDASLIRRCVDEVFGLIGPGDGTVLDLPTAIRGKEGDHNAIKRNTSMGYPLAYSGLGGTKKFAVLGKDEDWKFDDPIIVNGVRDFERLAQDKIIFPVIFSDTLKDETRPILKVEEGKTRVFSAGPVVFTIVFRKYFLDFIMHVQEGYIDNEIAVGINCKDPHSWGRLFRHLQQRGEDVFAGDFSNYDGTLNPQVLEAIFCKIDEWYGGTVYDTNVRMALMHCVINAVHIKKDYLYQWTHGQPSGCPITSIINSIYNSVMARICYYDLDPTFPRFSDNVSMISYGDDNVFNFPPWFYEDGYLSLFCDRYSKFGMTYTDAKKTGKPTISTIYDVDFLKRRFHFVEDWLCAPLDLDSCLDTLNWVKGKHNLAQNLEERVRDVLDELMHHGREIFDKYSRLIFKYCGRHGIKYNCDSFDTRFLLWQKGVLGYN